MLINFDKSVSMHFSIPVVKRQILSGAPPSEHSNSSHDLSTQGLPAAAISPKPSGL